MRVARPPLALFGTAALFAGLVLACGRTDLDDPVAVTGTAGAAGTGAAGTGAAGTAAGTGTAGTGSTPLACVEGTTMCDGPSTVSLCTGGLWQDSFTCAMGCTGGVCNECTPGTSACLSDTELHACSGSGIFQPPTTCDGACVDGACTGCAEGATRCASHEAQQICKAGAWSVASDCPFVCVGTACGQNAKKVFVTSSIFPATSVNGLAGADNACEKFAFVGHLTGTFRAWLSDSTGSPSSRFSEDAGPYVLVDGTIVADNWTDLTSGTIRHAIDLTESGGAPTATPGTCLGAATWSDTTAGGTLDDPMASCGNWTSMGVLASWGDATSTAHWSAACESAATNTNPSLACTASAALFCFEQ